MTAQLDTTVYSADPLINVEGVSIGYPGRVAVERIDLAVRPNEFVSIIGPSGCGKSTLLHVLSGINEPIAGSIAIRGFDATGSVGSKLKVGYVFQDHRLLPWRSVAENLNIAMKNAGVPKADWAESRRRYLSLLHVADYESSMPMNLSGGQRQRVSIARALCVQPDVVLMDEPFSGLDEVTARTIRRQLDCTRTAEHPATVFVTHSIREALYLSDRMLILSRGPARVIKEVTVDLPRPRLYDDPRILEMEQRVVSEVLEQWEIDPVAPNGAQRS
ncbi:ABC transporter ATP-binding protein [Mycobacterium sp. AMU20-3851]|uniref:ABC transporter ATP-binding protein n=1 Tax=Mycobacterium sp. AMU20-3851 TaxID=3122055 RepID=UPI0037541053